jgi:methionyl-tRNA formyltransferase
MRVAFLGSGPFAVPALRAIQHAGHDIPLVMTQPPRPAGRGGKLRATAVAEAARQAGLNPVPCENVNAPEGVEAVRSAGPDAICVVDFGQLVRSAVRDLADHGAMNLHGSLLPALRGAAPVNWAILRGHATTGVTTFSLVDKLDAGPIYLRDETQIDPNETAEELKARLAAMGAELICRTLGQMDAGWLTGIEQDPAKVTLAPKLTKRDGHLDWSRPAAEVRNRIHGTWPWPGGQAVFRRSNGKMLPVVIARAHVLDAPADGPPGTVDGEGAVATGRGRLGLVEIKPAGKRLMSWKDFTNGYRVEAGNVFLPPQASHG